MIYDLYKLHCDHDLRRNERGRPIASLHAGLCGVHGLNTIVVRNKAKYTLLQNCDNVNVNVNHDFFIAQSREASLLRGMYNTQW